MNKIMIVVSIFITILFINAGLSLRSQTMDKKKQKDGIVSENSSLLEDFEQKQRYQKNEPMTISDAFNFFVNETKMFETYSGTKMDIVFTGSQENESIENHYVGTEFRNVKGLPITIRVEKFSRETDMAGVLNDIYLLENHTDFKISEISTENNDLIVKGELYGI